MLIATAHGRSDQQTIELVLYYQLSVIVIGCTVVFFSDSFSEHSFLVAYGLDVKMIDFRYGFEQKPATLIKAEHRSFQFAFTHLPQILPSQELLTQKKSA
jgi:hypothetical protein